MAAQMPTETADDIKAMSFEQALEALERIVDDLERGDVPLDQSIRIYGARRSAEGPLRPAAEGGRGQGGKNPPFARRQAGGGRAARSGVTTSVISVRPAAAARGQR